MPRSIQKQSDHNKCVARVATEWQKDGWIVEADLEGWPTPSAIGGYIPDITAHKGSITRICEVETDDTLETHREQWETFRRYAQRTSNVSFWLFEAKAGGPCRFLE